MARRSLVRIAFILSLLSHAVTAAPPDPALIDALAAAKPSSISGTVIDETTGLGVAGVDVWLFSPFGSRAAKTVTRADGRYVLRPPPGGTYFHVLAPGSFELGLGPALYDGLQCLLGCELVTGTPVKGKGHLTGVDLTLTSGGRVSGRVTDAATSGPLAHVTIQVWDHAGTFVTHAVSGADGRYVAAQLPDGRFFVSTRSEVSFGDDAYLDRIFDGLPCLAGLCDPRSGTPVEVRKGEETAGVDFALTRGASISGTVRDGTGEPVDGARVTVQQNPSFAPVSDGVTEGGGRYTVTGLDAGSYFVAVLADEEYPGELYEGVTCGAASCDYDLATPVAVTADANTGGVDFAVKRSTGQGSLSGRVTEQGSGLPVAGVTIHLANHLGRALSETSSGPDGSYRLDDVPAGSVNVFTSNRSGYLDELYDDIPCHRSCSIATGSPVVVADGAETRDVDFELILSGGISGTVTDEAGQGVAGAEIQVYDPGGEVQSSDFTDEDGRFEHGLLRAGTYFVLALPAQVRLGALFDALPCNFEQCDGAPGRPCYAPLCDVTAGTPVAVEKGAVTEGVDLVLREGATLAGRVSDEMTGNSIAGVPVVAFNADGSRIKFTRSLAEGEYELTGLASGSYFVGTESRFRFLDEVFPDLPCPYLACDVTMGTPVAVDVPAATESIDLTLGRGGAISGTVTEAATALPFRYNVTVTVFDAAGSPVAAMTVDGNGNYKVSGLAAGSYFVSASGLAVRGELYPSVPCDPGCDVTAGTPVPVEEGAETSGIDLGLALATGSSP